MTEGMDIYSIKVLFRKCGINSSAGYKNIFGRETLPKSIIFPQVRIKYRNEGVIEYNGISEYYDLKLAGFTEKSWEGACCGSNYFLISNASCYSLFDKNCTFIKLMYVKDVGILVRAEALFFVTRTSDGIERTWWGDGSLKEENTLSPEQMPELKKGKNLRKGEFIAKI